MPYKDNKKQALAERKHYRKSRKNKEWLQSFRNRKKEDSKKRRIEYRQILDNNLGDKCLFCKENIHLVAHRTDGTPHEDLQGIGKKRLIEELETHEYVRLCLLCHNAVHWCMRIFKMNWNQIRARSKVG